ncbi:hypothetical protein EGR_06946 [Echinococcus granulosus]|uniref:Uncharacterized protein n=1 Tax=Echinococcus granulosus TaxID=6210 RepID=W6UJ84_ECHGR|nr:hypothetical protein EGR_06946 [Echinococcus granulosus]EUB58202.1 hypothetical protein EGR_06946 [Echinococcus granulosus]
MHVGGTHLLGISTSPNCQVDAVRDENYSSGDSLCLTAGPSIGETPCQEASAASGLKAKLCSRGRKCSKCIQQVNSAPTLMLWRWGEKKRRVLEGRKVACILLSASPIRLSAHLSVCLPLCAH